MTDYKRKIYLTIIISAILAIGLILFLIRPLVEKVKALSNDLEGKNAIVASYEERSSSYLIFLRNARSGFGQKILKVNKSFANPEKIIEFILSVEETAVLTDNYQEIKESVSAKEKKILLFQISLWGSFPNLIKFLAQLENMDYFVNINSLQITRIDGQGLRDLVEKGFVVSAGDLKSIIEIEIYTH